MGIARKVIERLSRGRVFKRYLPQDFGSAPLLVSPDASLRFWKTRIESDLFDFAREFVRPGSVVWDIGANVGLFTIAAAQLAGQTGHVVAVEADIWLVDLLQRSVSIQPATSSPIQVVPAAASSAISLKKFNIARRGRASNFLSEVKPSSQTGGIRTTYDVVSITLDWLLDQGPTPNVVKIDVEGAEFNVLGGSLRVISQARPVFLCEVRSHASEITELFVENGYVLYNWDVRPRTPIQSATYNTLALPAKVAS